MSVIGLDWQLGWWETWLWCGMVLVVEDGGREMIGDDVRRVGYRGIFLGEGLFWIISLGVGDIKEFAIIQFMSCSIGLVVGWPTQKAKV
jgi:hypothetical protein